MHMRYVKLFAFLASLSLGLIVLEGLLHLLGAPISLRDTRGVGQVGLLVITILAIMLFVATVAGVNPMMFAWHYVRHWRRALSGFATILVFVLLLEVILTAVFVQFGRATWSPEHWQTLGPRILLIALTKMAVALVLAITEEIIFRATFMRYLRSALTSANTITAILVSAALFSISHLIALDGLRSNTEGLLFGLFLLGILLATTYVISGSIVCAIGFHFGLLGFKVFLRETGIVSFDGDVRASPEFYAIMITLIALVLLSRRLLWSHFAIEPAALLNEEVRNQHISSPQIPSLK